ncbi:SDR family NAD(P)-dependent oxidoreductase [bacterium]|jgi:pteridine reductase|nr:SDR family NAD(P)-dependent oxidoreductase [bacterium]
MARKVALVTGSSKRIGAAIATRLSEQGYTVWIHFNRSKDEALALMLKLEGHIVQADLSDASEASLLIPHILKSSGRLDVLVNNAASFYSDEEIEEDPELDDIQRKINLESPTQLMEQYGEWVLQDDTRHGHIINLLDQATETGNPTHTAYIELKKELATATYDKSIELGPQLKVIGISPGHVLDPVAGQQLMTAIDVEANLKEITDQVLEILKPFKSKK